MHRRRSRRLTIVTLVTLAGVALAIPAHARPRPDFDKDGLPDRWEKAHGLDWRHANARADPDHDGVSNIREFRLGTDPRQADGHPLCDALASALGPDASDCPTVSLTEVLL